MTWINPISFLRGRRDELDRLRYLEKLTDFEGGIDCGPLCGKEILVYSYEKTGTVTLLYGVGQYLMSVKNWDRYQDQVLHNHHHRLLVNTLRALPGAPSRSELLSRPILRDLLRYKQLTGGHAVILSSYREPLDRAISWVFEHMQNQLDHGVYRLEQVTFDECHDLLLRRLHLCLEGDPHSLEEIEPDFFAKQYFDQETKCCYVDRGHYEILVVSLEHTDAWPVAFERHLGYTGIKFGVHNQIATKPIANLYREFKARLKLPKSLIERLYYDSEETKYLRWFCTEEEIAGYCRRALDACGVEDGGSAATLWRMFSEKRNSAIQIIHGLADRYRFAKHRVLRKIAHSGPNALRHRWQEQPEPWLVFLHIPKTACTSLRQKLMEIYGGSDVLFYEEDGNNREVFDWKQARDYSVLKGHKGLGFYPEVQTNLYLSILRSPVARAASLFAHYVRPDLAREGNAKMLRESTLSIWIERGMDTGNILRSIARCREFRKEISNQQCAYLSRGPATFEAALKSLRERDFVIGSVESLTAFYRALEDLLGWEAGIPRLNRSTPDAHRIILREPGAEEAIAELNLEDMKLWAFIEEEHNGLFINLPHAELFRASRLYVGPGSAQ